MKYLIFICFALISVPLMAGASMRSPTLRGWLVAFLVFSPMLGDLANINFMSMEWYRGPDRGFEVAITDLISLGLALGLLAGSHSRISWFPPGSIVMFLFFLICLVSSALAPEPIFSIFSLFKMLRVWLLYWTLFNCLKVGTPLDCVFQGLMSMAIVITFVCLKQKYLGGLYRVHATFDHSNTIPPYTNLVMPALFLWGLAAGGWSRIWSLAATMGALGLTVCVLATQSRAGLALSGGCLLTALAVANWRSRSMDHKPGQPGGALGYDRRGNQGGGHHHDPHKDRAQILGRGPRRIQLRGQPHGPGSFSGHRAEQFLPCADQ